MNHREQDQTSSVNHRATQSGWCWIKPAPKTEEETRDVCLPHFCYCSLLWVSRDRKRFGLLVIPHPSSRVTATTQLPVSRQWEPYLLACCLDISPSHWLFFTLGRIHFWLLATFFVLPMDRFSRVLEIRWRRWRKWVEEKWQTQQSPVSWWLLPEIPVISLPWRPKE